VLEDVAREAGYTRGALYHLFAGKQDLALAVVDWVAETWREEVGELTEHDGTPLGALIASARGHAIYCRRDVARVMMALRVEFAGRDHPVGRRVDEITEEQVKRAAALISAGRCDGSIPAGPPARKLGLAWVGAIEGAIIQLAGQAPYDEVIAVRVALGVLGLSPD
jgi:AcrR family transcriptional regulator